MAASSPTDRIAPLLTPGEVAAILRVTPRTVRRYGEAGVLERVAIGGRIRRYTAASVQALVEPHNDVETAGNGLDGKERDDGAQRAG